MRNWAIGNLISTALAFYFYINQSDCQTDVFNIDMHNLCWLEMPKIRHCQKPSLYGFSISIDESKHSAFVGAPGCNGLFECKLDEGDACEDISRKIYSANNPGKNCV